MNAPEPHVSDTDAALPVIGVALMIAAWVVIGVLYIAAIVPMMLHG